MKPSRSIDRLLEVMAALRTPETGCPWDLEQDFTTIAPYTIEEAYEVSDAIERNDLGDLCDELGDLLLQVVFHARMAQEIGKFDFGDVVLGITRKMIRRHPHVFDRNEGAETPDAAGVKVRWEDIKAEEKAERDARRLTPQAGGERAAPPSVLADIPQSLPAPMRAQKLQKRAARIGFDWHDAAPVLEKIHEEIGELKIEMDASPVQPDRLEDEIGDLMFAVVNLARHLRVDPEKALRRSNGKFEKRFRHLEAEARNNGTDISAMDLTDLDALWEAAKREIG